MRTFIPGSTERRARRGITLAPLDLDQAEAARAESLERIGGAQLGDVPVDARRGAHHGSAGGNDDANAVDLEGDHLLGYALGRAAVGFLD